MPLSTLQLPIDAGDAMASLDTSSLSPPHPEHLGPDPRRPTGPGQAQAVASAADTMVSAAASGSEIGSR